MKTPENTIPRTASNSLLAALMIMIALCGCSKESRDTKTAERAENYFKAGKLDEARIEYLNLLREDPANQGAIRQMGLIWTEYGSPLMALPFLNYSKEQSPDDLEIRGKFGAALFAVTDFAGARREAIAVLDLSPTDDEAILLLANASRSEEQIEEATARLEKLDSGTSATFHLAAGILSGRAGAEPDVVKASLDRALAIEPNLPGAHLAIATFHAALGESDKELEELQKAAELSPLRSSARLRYIGRLARSGEPERALQAVEALTAEERTYLPALTLNAELTLAAGDPDKALTRLNEVFSRDPKFVAARRLQARILLKKGEPEKAAEIMGAIVKEFSGTPGPRIDLAKAYLQAGDLESARTTLGQALTIAPESPEIILLMAQLDLRTGNAKEAVFALERFVKLSPDLVPHQLLLAQAYQIEGRYDDAAAIFQARIEAGTDGAGPYQMLGRLERFRKNPEAATKLLEQAQELAPEVQSITFDLVELDLERGDFESAHRRVQAHLDREADWGAYFLEGKIYHAEGKLEEAEASLSKSLELKPDSVSVYNLMIDNALKAENPEKAMSRLESALEKNPQNLQYLMTLALLNEREKNYQKAEELYQKILAFAPEFVPVLNNLAYLCLGPLDRLEEARTLAAKAYSLAPEDPAITDTYGWALFQLKEYQRALVLLEKAAGKSPDQPEIQFHVGMARYQSGASESARTAFEKALSSDLEFPGKEEAARRLALLGGGTTSGEIQTLAQLKALAKEQPDDPIVQSRLAHLYQSNGQFAEAAAAYESALKINPDLVAALVGAAKLYAGPLGDLEKAGQLARKARKLAPGDAGAAAVLGSVTLQEGEFAYARTLLREAIAKEPDSVELRWDLARSIYSLGKVNEARAEIQRVAAEATDASLAAEAGVYLAMTKEPEGGWKSIESEVETKLSADPEFVPALMIRAELRQSQGEAAVAIGGYRGILERLPDFAPAQLALADLLAEEVESLDEARTLATKAREAMPNDGSAAAVLGEISYRKGDTDYAIRLLEEAASKDSLDAEGNYYLGRAYLDGNRVEEGQKLLKEALALGLEEALAVEAKEMLSK